jgi:hypothetical protein
VSPLHHLTNNDPFTPLLDEALETALTTHIVYCLRSNQVRPATVECLNEFGSLSPLFESPQRLVLLDHGGLFSQARDTIRQHLNCTKMGWIHLKCTTKSRKLCSCFPVSSHIRRMTLQSRHTFVAGFFAV